ncbi:MAG: NAD(P)/FAD-dependent oxidoreductase [Alistipes sp.]|nr:NAD(P)/FAD-dependent oxidoreductase [Alistipes sp.]MBQ5854880.1 NAD(P)/FAD-dependent oxidoreductase [Alistipes sp.]
MEEIFDNIPEQPAYDVIVIGAGAAGMMAAGTAARNGAKVLLLEKMEKPARKIRITGKGRCNLTNARGEEEFAANIRTNYDFIRVAYSEFNNRATMRFFERLGVKLKTERGDRVFPLSDKAADIANALEFYCRDYDVEIRCHTRVSSIVVVDNKVLGVKYFNKRGFERRLEAPNVIVATGGISYPRTGSTGDGYLFADSVGHTIEDVRPSLTALVTSHPQAQYINNVLLRNTTVRLVVDGEVVAEEFGEVSFSDRGIEGAATLRLSRDAVDALTDEKSVKLELDLKPALDEEILRARIAREVAEMGPEEFFAELVRRLVPKPLVVPICKELDVHSRLYISKVSDKEFERLIKVLKSWSFPISDYASFDYAIVTAGGVNCSEINEYTMESKLIKGLYFAGEVLDVDANTGGYNLQTAFSTGHLAGLLKK